MKMKTALTVAGSDCSGGAGIQADIKTMTMNGVYAMSAVTALTAQNTTGVRSILESSAEFLGEQIDMIFEDIRPDAVKIGMVANSDLIRVISERLRRYGAKNIVVDPVMVATSGSALMKTDAVRTLTEELFPIASVVTPNISEAEVLSAMTITGEADMEAAAKQIGDAYGCAVLLKGGHSVSQRSSVCRRRTDLVYGKTHRQSEYPRHGLHAFKCHRRESREGLFAEGVGRKSEKLHLRRALGDA